MTYVVTENCIQCKYTDCVDVCPVDCFVEGPNFLAINPDECIDCTLCVCECPAEAIFAEEEVPADQKEFIELNARLAKVWPVISSRKEALKDANDWNGKKNKADLLKDYKLYLSDEFKFEEPSSEEDVDLALKDKNPYAKCKFIKKYFDIFNKDQINRCLQDDSIMVRIAVIENEEFKPDFFQFIQGVKSDDFNESRSMLKKIDKNIFNELSNIEDDNLRLVCFDAYIKYKKINNNEMLRYANDRYFKIRLLLFSSSRVNIPDDILKIGLNDKYALIRSEVVKRKTFKPTYEQFLSGVKDQSKLVRKSFSMHAESFGFSAEKSKIKFYEDNLKDKVFDKLLEIRNEKTWTKAKHVLKDEILKMLDDEGYFLFSSDRRSYGLTIFGQSKIVEVSESQMGTLSKFRGKKIRLLCIGNGTYSSVYLAAKAV